VVGLTRIFPQLKAALSSARASDLARIDEGLRSFGITGVHGEAEVGVTSLIEIALRRSQQNSIRVDLDGATSDQDVAWLIARGTARLMIGHPEFSLLELPDGLRPTSADKAFLRFADQVGERLARFALAETPADDVSVAEALQGVQRIFEQHILPPVVWIDHLQTPSLTPRHPLDVDALLWNVRSLQQQMEVPIFISGHKTATPLAYGEARAFHGDGVWITIERPTLDAWQAVAASVDSHAPSPAWVVEMVELTHAHSATTLLALSLFVEMPDRARTPLDLWQMMLALDDGHLDRTLAMARTLHRLGGRIFEQIAKGTGPYTEPGSASIKEIHRAVRRLHEAGLITQPRPRAWEITNPLVAGRLRGHLPLTTRDAVGSEAYDDYDPEPTAP
jgi:hypothetical protein